MNFDTKSLVLADDSVYLERRGSVTQKIFTGFAHIPQMAWGKWPRPCQKSYQISYWSDKFHDGRWRDIQQVSSNLARLRRRPTQQRNGLGPRYPTYILIMVPCTSTYPRCTFTPYSGWNPNFRQVHVFGPSWVDIQNGILVRSVIFLQFTVVPNTQTYRQIRLSLTLYKAKTPRYDSTNVEMDFRRPEGHISIPDFVIKNIKKNFWWQLYCHCPFET